MTAPASKFPGDLLTESPREPAEGLTTPRTSAGNVTVPRSVLDALRQGYQLNDQEWQ